ncbi:Ldh family oxidoreductase [Pelagovum pacificum]|uniref:Ldh family oxidoreductase n=1 Tax=Pelagovum pacificum TaxID=2588711 RepID=A0A5C5G7B5_9RHOB|nr:Ldh family oxidoreductase [Pelagovum pacificum]QQA41960.1 Ldh family oxidoreductase [Pelagovum pacificum]TNY30599.1 Ldh family oxidoreductase [Pelagovum pacificum]
MKHLTIDELTGLLTRILAAHGAAPGVAEVLAQRCAACERDGAISHGVFRIPGIARTLAAGDVHGELRHEVEDPAPGVLRADAKGGFAQPVFEALRPRFVQKVRDTGIAVLAIRNAHHTSALWPDVEPLAEEGMIALAAVNCFACSLPFGAKSPVFGTNPFGFSAPRADGPPITFDMATTAMSHGDIQLAARDGRAVPEETGTGRDGLPTTDPQVILDGGALLPFGGHKGAAISMMVELLCAGLGGGALSLETGSSSHEGVFPSITGLTVIAIDSRHSAGGSFAQRAADLVHLMEDAGISRLPGQKRHDARATAAAHGIPLTDETWLSLLALEDGRRGS